MSLVQFFLSFTKIGIFTIGGGHALIPLIEKYLVEKDLISRDELYELVAISESIPGVFATNLSALVGFRIRGFFGGLVAALASIIAPFIIILILAMFFSEYHENPYIIKVFKALRPAVVALILSPIISMLRYNKFSLPTYILPVLALVLMIGFKLPPIWVVVMGLLIGLSNGLLIPLFRR